MGRYYLPGFHKLQEKHDVQKVRLGEIVLDDNDDRWSYCELMSTIKEGHLVRDGTTGDLLATAQVSSGLATITATAAIGSDELADTGAFAGLDLVGCLGQIVDGTGLGQSFYITNMIDDDKVNIAILNDQSGFTVKQGWQVALDITSKYRLYFPGRVYQADGLGDFFASTTTDIREHMTRGVSPRDTTKKANEPVYGWFKQSGQSNVLEDASDTNIHLGELLIPSSGGTVQAFASTNPPSDWSAANFRDAFHLYNQVVGRATLGGLVSTSTDRIIRAELDIKNSVRSQRRADRDHALNLVTVR